MTDTRKELLDLIRGIHAGLRALEGFGVRSLGRTPAAAPAPVASTEARQGYQFGDARRARWEAAMRGRGNAADRSLEGGRQQVHMFAPATATGGARPEEVTTWQPNPLSAEEAQSKLDDLRREIGDCTRCRLHEERNAVVFGEGDPRARLVLAGEGPGREEDRTGRPFVGRAGQLLDRILHAMGLNREDVYICNVVKCRPPNNRTPQEDEMRMCGQFLTRQLETIHPRHIIALGGTASKYLMGSNRPMNRLRGHFFEHPSGARLLPTFHPAYLLRNPAAKRDVWEDVQMVMAEMNATEEEA